VNIVAPSFNPVVVGAPLFVTLVVHGITAKVVKIADRHFNDLEEFSSYICVGTTLLTAMIMEHTYSKISAFKGNPDLFSLVAVINSVVIVLLFLGDFFLQQLQEIQMPSPSLMDMVARARKGDYHDLVSQRISIEDVEKGLRKPRKSERSLLLVGNTQVQLSIVEECARRVDADLLSNDSPLRGAEIYILDITTADVEERKKIASLSEKRNVILVILNIEKLLEQNSLIAAFLQTKITTGCLTCIGLVTKENLKKIEKIEWFSRFSRIGDFSLR
jgi:FlaA1/EpsC-like NDP-sugar epimerase